jgi:hypothetical protein
VTVKFAFEANEAAGIVIVIAADLACVGVPLITIVTEVVV